MKIITRTLLLSLPPPHHHHLISIFILFYFFRTLSPSEISPDVAEFHKWKITAQKSLSPLIFGTQLNHVHCVLKIFILFYFISSPQLNLYASESSVASVILCVCVCVCVGAIKNNIIQGESTRQIVKKIALIYFVCALFVIDFQMLTFRLENLRGTGFYFNARVSMSMPHSNGAIIFNSPYQIV